MNGKSVKAVLVILVLLILCALAALAAMMAYSFLRPPRSVEARAGPAVRFVAPHTDDQVVIGQPTLLHVVASGEPRVVRVEVWIDGQLHEAQDTSLPDGVSPFPLVAYWQPTAAGTHTLIARAFDAQGGQGQSAVDAVSYTHLTLPTIYSV